MTTSNTSRYALVLGGAGFIGRHVSRTLSSSGFTVLGLGHGGWSIDESRVWGFSGWISADISAASLDSIARHRALDVVVHCAGSGTVSYSYHHPFADYSRAVSSVAIVLDWIRTTQATACRFVLISSAAVYGDQGTVHLAEEYPTVPVSPYGFHKLSAELISQSFSKFFGIPVAIVRLFSVYGAGLQKQLLWDALKKFDAGQSAFRGTGEELRDWIHVEDAADLILAVATKQQDDFRVYNGGSNIASIRKLLSALIKHHGLDADIVFNGLMDAGNPFSLCSDSSRAMTELDWMPKVGLENGLLDYSLWYKSFTA